MYFDTPRDYIGGVYDELLYGDQPLGWDIIGRKETVRGATRETFLDYLDRWYKPSRMVVGIGGQARRRPASAIERAARRPRAARDRRAARRSQPLPNGSGPHVKVHTKAVRPGAPRPRRSEHGRSTHPDRYILQLLATVLGGGMSSRLFTEVRERRGLAYYVYGAQPQLHRRRLAATRRPASTSTGSTRRSRRSSTSSSGSSTSRCRRTSSRRRRTSRRAASCSSSRTRRA